MTHPSSVYLRANLYGCCHCVDGSLGEPYTHGPGGDEPLVSQRQPKIFYYEADGLSSITTLTNAAGVVVNSSEYDSFGKLTTANEAVSNPFRFTGREWDSEINLYYYRARYYDPLFGRFLSEDPISFMGRDTNLYRSVRNNPVNFIDPLGLLTLDPDFPAECLPSMERALGIVRGIAKRDVRCNCAFVRIGDHRSLRELVDDPRITVQYDPVQEYTLEGGPTVGYTEPGIKTKVVIQPYACRMGGWTLACALIHELTHISLTPGPGQEGLAQQMEINCGFRKRVITAPIVVTGKP